MEIIGILAGILTLLTYIPQSVKTIRTQKTRDLSTMTLILLVSSAALWVTYGLVKHLPSVWFTNLVVSSLGLTILSIKLGSK